MRRFVWAKRGENPPHFELLCNGSVLGSLSWVQGSRTTAVAEMAGGVMIFRREGLLRQHVVIENLREETLARITLSPRNRSGTLKLPGGDVYSFGIDGVLEWLDEGGRSLARIGESDVGGGFVADLSASDDPLPLMLAFAGWYLYRTVPRHETAPATPRRAEPTIISPQTAA